MDLAPRGHPLTPLPFDKRPGEQAPSRQDWSG